MHGCECVAGVEDLVVVEVECGRDVLGLDWPLSGGLPAVDLDEDREVAVVPLVVEGPRVHAPAPGSWPVAMAVATPMPI